MSRDALELFFELLKCSTGVKNNLSKQYSRKDWVEAFSIAYNQAVVGVLLSGLEMLSKDCYPPQDVVLQWIGNTEIIERNTALLTKNGETVINYFREKGFPCQILKGASVGRYYLVPNRRSSGDIDVWLNGGRNKIYEFARHYDKDGKIYGANYHHIHFHLLDNVHIEVHIWPSYLSSPIRNYRLHRFCKQYQPTFDDSTPSLAFDRVFILLHCYRHMCGDGVGFRQIMDYYYVLKQGFNDTEKDSAVYWIKKLGMNRFCGGIIWVLKEYFGLEERFCLMPSNEKEGRFITNEILQTGNMGHGDTRNWGSKKTPLSRFLFNLRRDIYLARHYPHEALWQPFFSIWLYFWRLSKGLLGGDNDEN